MVERSAIEAVGLFQGMVFDVEPYLRVLMDPVFHRFLPRGAVETDLRYKQLIPYHIIMHGDRVWYYVRSNRSGEERLVARVSIGVGGHINDLDRRPGVNAYMAGARRELEEEVRLPDHCEERVVALLNDDSNPVGQVHLGVVHVVQVGSDDVAPLEDTVLSSGFATAAELEKRDAGMETWSRICLRNIVRLRDVAGMAVQL